jgi:hypothetical protein
MGTHRKTDDPVEYSKAVAKARAHANRVLMVRYREEHEKAMVEWMEREGWDYTPRRVKGIVKRARRISELEAELAVLRRGEARGSAREGVAAVADMR